MEILMLVGILAYVLNYITGKSKNQKLSTAWYVNSNDPIWCPTPPPLHCLTIAESRALLQQHKAANSKHYIMVVLGL